MKSTDKPAFALAIAGCMTEIYEKAVSPALLELWFNALDAYSLADVRAALHTHITDPDAGRFPPKPADVIRQLQARQPDEPDDHPGPEEAWGMLLRFVNDERETGLLTEPMREGWAACSPILELGDEVGARMCFLETYRKALKIARNAGQRANWSITLGTDVERRKTAIQAAVDARRITLDYAQSLLPAPAASLEHLAGLLEHDGPKPGSGQPSLSERLQGLAASLRQARADEEQQAMAAEQERRAAIDARKPAPEPEADDEYREAA
jgi:hypothetical protein